MVIGHGGAVLKKVGDGGPRPAAPGAYVELSVRVAPGLAAQARDAGPLGPVMGAARASPVYIEAGAKRVFACSLEWPGLCRVAKTEEAALLALSGYVLALRTGGGPRRRPVPALAAGHGWEVVERVPTRSGGADFGAPTTVLERRPRAREPAGGGPSTAALAVRRLGAVRRGRGRCPRRPCAKGRGAVAGTGTPSWTTWLRPEQMFAQRVGIKLAVPAPGDRAVIEANRAAILDWCRSGEPLATARPGWPPRYAARRLLWHVLDHAWEIEDRSVDGEDRRP